MKKKVKIFLWVLILLVLVGAYWFFYIKKENCELESCFKENLLKCKRASYQRNEIFSYRYEILGEKSNECVVDVTLIFAGGEPKFQNLVGKKMRCHLPLNYFTFPEKEIEYCSGPLKEEAQFLLIKEAYTYIAQNLGK